MKFQVELDVLEPAVAATARTLPPRPAILVLAGMWIRAYNGVVSLFAFDYEMSSETSFEAEIEEEGQVLVSGKMLASISKQLPKSTVTVELIDGKVQISCGKIRYELMQMALEDYPEAPKYPQSIGSIDGGQFTEAISQVAMASSRDETLPLLATVRMELKGNSMALMATDRYRLAVRQLTWEPDDENIDSAGLVKARKMSEIAKSFGVGDKLGLALNTDPDSAQVFGVETPGRKLTATLSEGDYPPVIGLFPTELPIQAVVNREQLVQALKRMSLVVEHSAQVRMAFKSDTLVLDAGQGDSAQASEQLACAFNGEDEMSVAFNPTYLREGLTALKAEYARISFTTPTKPAVITGQAELDSEELTDFRYLLMPIRYAG